MLTDNPDLQRGAKRGGTENFSGADRAVMLSSLARGRGLKFSPTKGLVDPEKGDEVVANTWDKIAVVLLGPGAKEEDTHTVEQMLAKIKNLPEYEQLVQGIRDNFEKQGRMFPESAKGIMHGIKLAEARVDELRNFVKSVKGGYAVGRKGDQGSLSKMAKTYKDAGGQQTTIGQIVDPIKKGFDKVFGKDDSDDKDNSKDSTNKNTKSGNIFGTKIPNNATFQDKQSNWWQYYPKEGRWYSLTNKKLPPLMADEGFSLFKKAKYKSESILREAARIDHAEDLVYLQGSQGAMRALQSLRNMSKSGQGNVTLKWDGSPAIIFGRNEDGAFVLTDKGGFVAKGYDGKATSGEDLQSMLMARPGAKNPDKVKRDRYIQFAKNMGQAYSVFEKAVPESYRGYFKGDLLYYTTPQVIEKNFVFKPNIVEYAVDVASDLGKKIAKSTAGVVCT